MLLAVLVTLFLAIHLVCEQFVALLNALRPELEPAPEPEPEVRQIALELTLDGLCLH